MLPAVAAGGAVGATTAAGAGSVVRPAIGTAMAGEYPSVPPSSIAAALEDIPSIVSALRPAAPIPTIPAVPVPDADEAGYDFAPMPTPAPRPRPRS